jgi:hypothetical protein
VTVPLAVRGRIDVEPPERVPRTVGAAVDVLLRSRGDAAELQRVFERSSVPMAMADNERRYVNANRPARLAFRLSEAEFRQYAIDDLTPTDQLPMLEAVWARLIDAGSVAGRYPIAGPDGARFDIVYYAVANVLPGLHVAAFAPADWPEDELGTPEGDLDDHPETALTPRELEVLRLAAQRHPPGGEPGHREDSRRAHLREARGRRPRRRGGPSPATRPHRLTVKSVQDARTPRA